MSEFPDITLPDAAPSAGRTLAAARQRQGLSIADVARQIKWGARQIEALEQDQYEKLPGDTFVRGFIRNYAKLLQIDPEPLLRAVQEKIPSHPLQTVVPPAENIPFPSAETKDWRIYAVAGVVMALIVPLAWYEEYRAKPEAPARLPAASPVTQTLPSPPAATPAPSPLSTQAEPIAPSAAAIAAGPVASVDGAPQANLIHMTFEEESWVEIRDKRGKTVFSRLNPAGTHQAVAGSPPFSLVVGNAAHVKMAYNDRPVDLTPHIKVEVARFTLE